MVYSEPHVAKEKPTFERGKQCNKTTPIKQMSFERGNTDDTKKISFMRTNASTGPTKLSFERKAVPIKDLKAMFTRKDSVH
jgi:hypothetical protein